MRAISLYDYTGNVLKPWAEAGYECYALDIQHDNCRKQHFDGGGIIHFMEWDAFAPDQQWVHDLAAQCGAGFAFTPCTDMAVSGARWFKGKGLRRLAKSIEMFAVAAEILDNVDGPTMQENPVSTISTYWRKPDHTFNPHDYTGFCKDDNYTKKTCLWTNEQFVMPPANTLDLGAPDDRIHKAAPGEERANFRSATPMGFTQAVFLSNQDALT